MLKSYFWAAMAALALIFSTSAAHAEWTLKEINSYIDNTNWILDDSCSGTTISAKDRLVLTNFHCVVQSKNRVKGENYRQSDVYLSRRTYKDYSVVKEETYAAEVIGVDIGNDLALLQIRDTSIFLFSEAKIPAEKYEYIRGQKVYLVGNPSMMDNSLIIGYVSSVARTIYMPRIVGGSDKDAIAPYRYIQVSGGVFGGASGGSVYDEEGNFIGVTAATTNGATYIGFAIPVDVVKTFLTQSGKFKFNS